MKKLFYTDLNQNNLEQLGNLHGYFRDINKDFQWFILVELKARKDFLLYGNREEDKLSEEARFGAVTQIESLIDMFNVGVKHLEMVVSNKQKSLGKPVESFNKEKYEKEILKQK